MKNIYFVQAGNLYGSNAYLPYAAGCVAANAFCNPKIRAHYHLGHFTFLRTPIEEVVNSYDNPFLVAFSCYLWNFEYHKTLAQAIKTRWPQCYILFGGHNVLNESSQQLNDYPYIDFLLHRAGEIPFEQLLLTLHTSGNLNEVPSLSFRNAQGQPQRTQDAPCTRCDFPSPYLNGFFDDLFAQYPHILFSMTFETNRGCPYACTYCDWGTARQKVHMMPMERVKAEIDWAAQHNIEYLFCADGNFGMFERDSAIVDYLAEKKQQTGYPTKFGACFAKNSNEMVFALNRKLCAHKLNNGATLSFQSLSPSALENIHRKNLGLEAYADLLAQYNQSGVPVYSELILGLPGETLQSFTHGIGQLLAAGLRGMIQVYPCEVLLNAAMATPDYQQEHGIKAVRVNKVQRYCKPATDDIPEYSSVVVQTSTMPIEDWVQAMVFSTLVEGLHCFGLLPLIAVYLHHQNNLPYERFYLDLMDFARENPNTFLGEQLAFFQARYAAFAQGAGENFVLHDPRFGEITFPLDAAVFLRGAYEIDRLFAELPTFLQRYALPNDLLTQLLSYQKALVCLPKPQAQQSVSFDYNFPAYFSAVFARQSSELEKRHTTLIPEQNPTLAWPDFAREYVWYGRLKGALTRKGDKVIYD
ncbi:MAG: radical SAM protein [Oscillospiraceae bacterium]|nr:radical SAM protein [Oscillospiraceae bacterium]